MSNVEQQTEQKSTWDIAHAILDEASDYFGGEQLAVPVLLDAIDRELTAARRAAADAVRALRTDRDTARRELDEARAANEVLREALVRDNDKIEECVDGLSADGDGWIHCHENRVFNAICNLWDQITSTAFSDKRAALDGAKGDDDAV